MTYGTGRDEEAKALGSEGTLLLSLLVKSQGLNWDSAETVHAHPAPRAHGRPFPIGP